MESFKNKSLSLIYKETYKVAIDCIPKKTLAEKNLDRKVHRYIKYLDNSWRRIVKGLTIIRVIPSQISKNAYVYKEMFSQSRMTWSDPVLMTLSSI